PPVDPVEPGGAELTCLATTICVPSASGAARLIAVRSAPFFGPPAACKASMTRCPSVNSYTPGFCTQPATSTTIGAVVGEGLMNGPDETLTAGRAASTVTGLGRDREYQSPAPPRSTTSTPIRPKSSPRDNEASRSRRDMRATLRPDATTTGDGRH